MDLARRVVLPLLDRLLQLVVPVRTDRLCYLSTPDHSDNAAYLFRHALRTRRDLEHVWLVDDPASADRIAREFRTLLADLPGHGHRLRIARRHSLRGYLLHLGSRLVLHTHGAYAFSRRARAPRQVVALWHGMPIKAIGRLNTRTPNPRPTVATASIATSTLYRYIIAAAFGLDAEAVKVVGLPRCDPLRFDDARAVDAVTLRRRLEVPEGRRLVVWLPTYRTQVGSAPADRPARSFLDELPPWALPALERACAAHGCTVLVKLHPFDTLNDAGPEALPGEHLRLVTAPEWQATGLQLYDLLAASDALLSDVSSVIVDYLATRRPIGLLGFDREAYDRDPVLPYELFFGSARFRALDDERAVDELLRSAGRDVAADVPATDVASALHVELPEPSAELLLRELGL